MSSPSYIAIEGPIGVGKTSLACRLAEDLKANLILEEPDANPFLPLFYADPDRYALAVQLSFLASRSEQQKLINNDLAARRTIISDYSYVKDWIFAELNLTAEELDLYRQIYAGMGTQIRIPELIVYLESDPALLRKHVKQRKTPYEKRITRAYLEQVLEAYNRFFFRYNEIPLVVVNCSQIDFVNNETHYQSLVQEILNEKRGKKHYVAIGK
jgi:deoxyguanosine kinase